VFFAPARDIHPKVQAAAGTKAAHVKEHDAIAKTI
jgi:hypothetical protein